MPSDGSGSHETYFRRAIHWMYGDTAYLHQTPPPEIGEKHVTELLGLHPFHPYSPDLPSGHPCKEYNDVFFSCMSSDELEGHELHMKHVSCYFPYKTNLMKCLAHEKRIAREKRQAEERLRQAQGQDAPARPQ